METLESLSKLRVVDLKQRLSELGLPVGGLKAELVNRLHKHISENDEAGDDGSNHSEEAETSPLLHLPVKSPLLQSPPRPFALHQATEHLSTPQRHSPSFSGSASGPLLPDTAQSFQLPPSPAVQQGPLMVSTVPAPIVSLQPQGSINSALRAETVDNASSEMQEQVRHQQLMLHQGTHEQDELFRLQQQALIEKQKEEDEKQAKLLRLQHEALKQKEDERKQLEALGMQSTLIPDESVAEEQESSGIASMISSLRHSSGLLPQPSTPTSGNAAFPLLPRPPVPLDLPAGRGGGTPSPGRGRGGGRVFSEGGRPRDREDRPPPLMSLNVTAPRPEEQKEMRLPQALEEALAFKQERAKQVGVNLDEENSSTNSDNFEKGVQVNGEEEEEEPMEHDYREEEKEFSPWKSSPAKAKPVMEWSSPRASVNRLPKIRPQTLEEDSPDEEEEEEVKIITSAAASKDKAKEKKKKKKKKSKCGTRMSWIQKQLDEEKARKAALLAKKKKQMTGESGPKERQVDVTYVSETIDLDYSDPLHRQFAKIFEAFKISEPLPTELDIKKEEKSDMPSMTASLDLKKVPKLVEDAQDDSDNEEEKIPKVSKRKMKLLKRMSIAELKQTVCRPDVVEMHDVTARDPKLLVHLKATRNTVPVPRHWCFKRKYLQGKRGIEKPPFELPDFIKKTGIMEMRAALQEKEDQKTLKAKMRDKVRPKMGKIDIDYQKLHDAFFKWQTKPEMTIHGDLYYEGKEYETKMKDKKPGELSDELRISLGMPVNANAHKVPPPWLIAMQRYGPPPSYPNLKIPGLNAPIPEGCSFGYHAGGWGKPPVDNVGKPIYGDVFGTQIKESDVPIVEEEVEKSLWGELESESEEESEEEESSEEEEDQSGLVTPGETGLVTPSGISSLPAGLETPDMIELRKKHMETEAEGGDTPSLYTVLPERRMEPGAAARAMMASTHTYDLSAVGTRHSGQQQGVEVALDPSELDLVDTDAMAARYEATLREQQTHEDEDFSEMVAEHAAKQRNKRRRLQNQDQNKPAKKYKDFKF